MFVIFQMEEECIRIDNRVKQAFLENWPLQKNLKKFIHLMQPIRLDSCSWKTIKKWKNIYFEVNFEKLFIPTKIGEKYQAQQIFNNNNKSFTLTRHHDKAK